MVGGVGVSHPHSVRHTRRRPGKPNWSLVRVHRTAPHTVWKRERDVTRRHTCRKLGTVTSPPITVAAGFGFGGGAPDARGGR